MKSRRLSVLFAAIVALMLAPAVGVAQRAAAPAATAGGRTSITPAELKEWLTYISSDELEGRQVFHEGLGLAANYIVDHLKEWGVKPEGDNGSYFQDVKVLGVDTTSNSSVTVTVNGQTRTFKDGEGVTFPKNQGGNQRVSGAAEFVGYGLDIPDEHIDDYQGKDVAGKVVIYVGSGPSTLPATARRLVGARARNAVELKHAVAAIGPAAAFGGRGGFGPAPAPAATGRGEGAATPAAGRGTQPPAAGRGGGRGRSDSLGDFTTVQRLDTKTPPQITASDEFFEFVFNAAGQNYADVKAKADEREALPALALNNVSISINVDADYKVVQTRLTRNVVGKVEGTDPSLRDTYVFFGAHYDHIGYQETPRPAGRGGFGGRGGTPPPPGGCVGQERDTPRPGDVINNGADDDGSGTVALMALAKAYALGPKPKRSVVFVWHTGEEAGLYGSRYMADYPEVPIKDISAQLNIDMIGRNRCDDPKEEDTVYVVGSDRISTELHNIDEDANASLPTPLKLDYEMNDPSDPESIYTRSDHYSYAAKGIPIIFYTTGLHRDYHYLTDEVQKIDFPKLAHIAQLVYTTGWRVSNLDHFPVRDNKGPRKGKGQTGKIQIGG